MSIVCQQVVHVRPFRLTFYYLKWLWSTNIPFLCGLNHSTHRELETTSCLHTESVIVCVSAWWWECVFARVFLFVCIYQMSVNVYDDIVEVIASFLNVSESLLCFETGLKEWKEKKKLLFFKYNFSYNGNIISHPDTSAHSIFLRERRAEEPSFLKTFSCINVMTTTSFFTYF